MAVSRSREFEADRGAAELLGTGERTGDRARADRDAGCAPPDDRGTGPGAGLHPQPAGRGTTAAAAPTWLACSRPTRRPRSASPACERSTPAGLSDQRAEQVVERGRRATSAAGSVGTTERRVAVALELVGQLGTAARDDATLHQDVHAIGVQLLEQPVVVGDDQHAERCVVVGERPRRGGRSRAAHRCRGPSRARRGWRCCGCSTASCSVSLRFFSPPDRSTFSERCSSAAGKPMRSASAASSASRPSVERPRATSASVEHVGRATTPGTSLGYCITRCSPACARCHAGSASRSTPSSVTDAAEHLVAGLAHDHGRRACSCRRRSGPSPRAPRR